jgi:hypothetical protein
MFHFFTAGKHFLVRAMYLQEALRNPKQGSTTSALNDIG